MPWQGEVFALTIGTDNPPLPSDGMCVCGGGRGGGGTHGRGAEVLAIPGFYSFLLLVHDSCNLLVAPVRGNVGLVAGIEAAVLGHEGSATC